MKLEQMEAQLKPAQFVEWLFGGGREYGIPEEVILAQAERKGYKVEEVETMLDTPAPVAETPKRGRKQKEQQ